MKTGFSINPYRQYFYCLCLRDSAVSVHYHNSFVDSHTSKRCGPPTPTPSPSIHHTASMVTVLNDLKQKSSKSKSQKFGRKPFDVYQGFLKEIYVKYKKILKHPM